MARIKIISDVLTIVLALSALFISGLVIWKVFVQITPSNQANSSGIKEISNWEELDMTNSLQPYIMDQKINILKFYDYQCAFCRQSQVYINEITNKYPEVVNFIYVHFPLERHEFAFEAALASECARDQGRFGLYHALLFENQENLNSTLFSRLAIESEIHDLSAFNNCLEQKKAYKKVNEHIEFANKLNINIIPSYVLNGTLISGVLTKEQLEKYIVIE